jgi:hypothetical protein
MPGLSAESLIKPLEALLKPLYLELRDFQDEFGLGGVLNYGASAIGKKSVTGWINYLPRDDPDEAILIAELELNLLEGSQVALNIFAGWSMGGIAKDYISAQRMAAVDGGAFLAALEAAFSSQKQQILVDLKVEMTKGALNGRIGVEA